jgi:hypothetical protein
MSRGAIFNAFYALISKYLPSIFNDLELENLRALFRLFRLMLVYHDPQLSAHLEEAGIQPELYATHWFLTLFAAGGCDSLATLQSLWTSVLIEDDPFFHYFLGLALLRLHRSFLLSTSAGKDLPVVLRGLVIRGEDLLGLLKEAKRLRAATPTSLRQTLFEISFAKRDQLVKLLTATPGAPAIGSTQSALASAAASGTFVMSSTVSTHLLEQFSSYSELLPCLTVPAAEIVQQAYSDLPSDGGADASGQMKYIVLDVRTAQEFAAGHLPCAIHISPSLLHIPSQLEALVSEKQYGGMRECHFCFVGAEAASFAEVQTQTSGSTGGFHALKIPAHRRPVAPPSPSSSLFALAESSRLDSGRDALAALQLQSVPVRDVTAVDGGATPVMGGEVGLSVVVGSPISRHDSSTNSGVLYRPDMDGASPSVFSPVATSPNGRPSNPHIVASPLLDSALASFVHFFLSRGFAHLSVCEGGFPAVHGLVKMQQDAWRKQKAAIAAGELQLAAYQTPLENITLVDHDEKVCAVCNAPPTQAEVTNTETSGGATGENGASSNTPPAASGTAAVSGKKDAGHSKKNSAEPPTTSNGLTDGTANGVSPNGSSKGAAAATASPVASNPASAASSSTSTPATDAAPKGPSALSKFSLGFKRFTLGVSDKLEKYKAEKAAADALKAIEKEKADALKAILDAEKEKARLEAAEKAAAEKAEKDRLKEIERKEQAEKAAAEKAEKERLREIERKEKEEKAAAEKAEKERLKEDERKKKELEQAATGGSTTDASSSKKSSDAASKESGLASRFLSALGIDKQRYFSQKYSRAKLLGDTSAGASDAPPASEVNAAIDLSEWSADKDNIALFHCHEISLLPPGSTPAPATPSAAAAGSTSTAPETPVSPSVKKSKRTGVLLPRVLVISAGYVIVLQPAKPPTKKPTLTPTAAGSAAASSSVDETSEPHFGLAFLKQKYRLIDLDKITSKRDRPSILTFHWKPNPIDPDVVAPGPAPPSLPPSQASSPMMSRQISATNPDDPPPTPSSSFLPHDRDSVSGVASPGDSAFKPAPKGAQTMFLVEKPQECIALVRSKFLLARASAALAESNKCEPTPEEEAALKAEIAKQSHEVKDVDEPEDAEADVPTMTLPSVPDPAVDVDPSGAVLSEAPPATPLSTASHPTEVSPPSFVISPVGGNKPLSPDGLEDLLDL